ncbi:PAS/PAC sensor signal transduction histidine kinase [Sulfurivirga caldicuralii]|uniref:histidine kinase n=1 Tax=Sulfurivirga caldicuralii TaxID=364032 RepID=A0A1N6FML3_9GAMM|nr:ATP-binding protein [Sulfurivirga caldicuralii]SIN96454.1 PAS/PAC sensor signal transduction histidine kinase [Sulfurivirga caldicuralii]
MASETSSAVRDEQARIRELEEAFALFNQTSLQLTQAYEGLQKQLASVQVELAEANQARRELSERLERLLDLLPAGVLLLNARDEIVEMNPAAEAILGKDAQGRLWEVVVRNVFLHVTDVGELITHDGRVYQLSSRTLDQPAGRLLLIQDVTAAHHLQQHRSRHQRLNSMGEMAASLAHQIRTPLSTALLYMSQLNNDMDPDKRQRFVERSLGSLRHIEGLVNDMLQYARGGRSASKPVEIETLLTRLQQALKPQLDATHSTLAIRNDSERTHLVGDEEALLTALHNLGANALEAGKEGVHVSIDVWDQEQAVMLSVTDDGPGIPEENQERIFEPFFTSRAQGTGLGLAVVRAVVEAHNGTVWVHSREGQGSTFYIKLPLQQSERDG